MRRENIESAVKAEKRLRSLERAMDRIHNNDTCISVGVLDLTMVHPSSNATTIDIAKHLDDNGKHDLRERVIDCIRSEIAKLEKEIEEA